MANSVRSFGAGGGAGSYAGGMPDVDWSGCWGHVAASLRSHITAGRQHLLTEDVVRFALIEALEGAGVEPSRIRFEHRVAGIGPIDLVVDATAGRIGAAVEVKFPRDPSGADADDTQTVGELLNDFYRLARLDADEAWALQVIEPRLARHLARRRDVQWGATAGEVFLLAPGLFGQLPKTARQAAAAALDDLAVDAHCDAVHSAGDLTVIAYRVRPAA